MKKLKEKKINRNVKNTDKNKIGNNKKNNMKRKTRILKEKRKQSWILCVGEGVG